MSDYPQTITQNPAPVGVTGQESLQAKQERVDAIMARFLSVLPSNYIAQVNGPFYTTQFQAIAEAIATMELEVQRIGTDSDVDFARPEFLWKIIGSLVFPKGGETGNFPEIDGDTLYRDLLKNMILLLLQGSGASTLQEGVKLLTDADVEVIEKVIHARTSPTSGWTLKDQHTIQVNVSQGTNKDEMPSDPFTLQRNVEIILQALKPAHVLIEYRNLLQETFGTLFTDEPTWEMDSHFYDDFRHFCAGTKNIVSSTGDTLTDKTLFRDYNRDFRHVQAGAILRITSGANAGRYEVVEVLTFPGGDDSTKRSYTLSPSGDSGKATVSGNAVVAQGDPTLYFDSNNLQEGEVLTFAAGPNAGQYRLHRYLGVSTTGNQIGDLLVNLEGSGYKFQKVEVAPTILRLKTRMPSVVTGQNYMLTVDRLGVKEVQTVTSENVSNQFYL